MKPKISPMEQKLVSWQGGEEWRWEHGEMPPPGTVPLARRFLTSQEPFGPSWSPGATQGATKPGTTSDPVPGTSAELVRALRHRQLIN